MLKNRQRNERKILKEERSPDIAGMAAMVHLSGEFAVELKQITDRQSGKPVDHVIFTFVDPRKRDRAFLLVHDHRPATIEAVKAVKNIKEMTADQRQKLRVVVNRLAYVVIRDNRNEFDYVVLKPAWVEPRGLLVAYAQEPSQSPPVDFDKMGRTLWIWRAGQSQHGLTVLKLIEDMDT